MDLSASVSQYFEGLKASLVASVKSIDPTITYRCDQWRRPEGGGGEANCFEGGELIEKGGINYSQVHGNALPDSATKLRPHLRDSPFTAMGVSVVFHPRNPHVPTTHMNVRFFTTHSGNKNEDELWWFGGGYDLTPYYPYEEDVISWHEQAKSACDPFGKDLYPEFKKNCDEYFYLPHRKETRGVGGLFFDDFNRFDFETSFQLTQSVGNSFFPNYATITKRRSLIAYTTEEKAFQCYRRGRYVEFNLLYDRGTLFGIQSGGRTESILMSLPPEVNWKYDWHPTPESRESELYHTYLKPQNWLDLK